LHGKIINLIGHKIAHIDRIFSINRGDAHDDPCFHRKGAENAKGLVFLFFAERPKNKRSIPSEGQDFSFAVLSTAKEKMVHSAYFASPR